MSNTLVVRSNTNKQNGQPRRQLNRRRANQTLPRAAARIYRGPADPPSGTLTVLQRREVHSHVTFASASSGSVTVAQFLAGAQGGSTITHIRFLRLSVYAPSLTTGDMTLTVADALPQNDGLVLSDTSTVGAARAQGGFYPTALDQMNFLVNTSQSLFLWTTTSAVTFLDVIALVEARV